MPKKFFLLNLNSFQVVNSNLINLIPVGFKDSLFTEVILLLIIICLVAYFLLESKLL